MSRKLSQTTRDKLEEMLVDMRYELVKDSLYEVARGEFYLPLVDDIPDEALVQELRDMWSIDDDDDDEWSKAIKEALIEIDIHSNLEIQEESSATAATSV